MLSRKCLYDFRGKRGPTGKATGRKAPSCVHNGIVLEGDVGPEQGR